MARLGSIRPWNKSSSRKQSQFRRLLLGWEPLEARRLLASDVAFELIGDADESAVYKLSPANRHGLSEPQPVFGPQPEPLPGPFANLETFRLHSKPGSNYTIFLDFDGHTTEGTTWNWAQNLPSIVSPAYDRGGTPGVFSQLELDIIQNTWIRVAEDFAPFDVNVTTEDPGFEALRKDTTGTDTQWGVRVIMTTDTFAACGCGGFAYLNSFQDSTDEPSFVFNNSLDGVSETVSHEVGHQLTLNHDGLVSPATEYYGGHGAGATSWGAIMGAPFSRRITQWDRGEYLNANNSSDDLLAITTLNGFGYRADDFGNTIVTAENLMVTAATSVQALGIIERNTDVDFFRFETGTGNVSFTVAPQADRPNLHVWAGIYDALGTLIAQSNPLDGLTALLTNVFLTAGTYFLKVDGVGSHGVYNPVTDSVEDPLFGQPWKASPPSGYSDYGSLGQYGISGTIVAPTTNLLSIAPLSADKREGNDGGTTDFTFTVSRAGDTSAASSVNYRVIPARQPLPGTNAPHTVDANDFLGGVLPSGTVSFLSGETSKQITLLVNADTIVERDEHFVVVLEGASAGWGYADSRAPGVIQGDESRANVKNGVQFRWRQENFNSVTGDNWAIDNVLVSNTTFGDDFDPGIDSSQWASIVNGTASSAFGGLGNSLRFSGAGSRTATTNVISAQSGDVLQFSLVFGSTGQGENVLLEYTLDGGQNWKLIRNYDQNFYKSWTNFSVSIPSDATADLLRLTEADSGSVAYPFTVFRTDNLDKSIDVSWSVVGVGANPADGHDFVGGVLPSGVVSFAPNQASQIVNVLVAGDTLFEADETFELRLTNSTGGPIGVDRNLAWILNNDSQFPMDFGDAPDAPYGTLLASNGARHTVGGPVLGMSVDTEADGQPSPNASGDGADEDGVKFLSPLVAGTTVNIQVTSSAGGGQLDYFFDFDGVGGFGNNPNEIFSATLSGGTQLLPVTIPAGAVSNTYARFRISTAGGLGPVGPAPTGEVEDYAVSIFAVPPPLDFGDAPASYSTLLVNDGARHIATGPRLGALVDAESDGQPSGMSTGDGADEDGIVFRSRLIRGTTVDVSVTSTGGQLNYFFDFDGNGVFGNASNEVFSASVINGTQTVPVVVPATAALGVTHARFRLSTAGGFGPSGLALDGEVEDYQIRVVDLPQTIFNFDEVGAPALPAGWTTSGTGTSNPWRTVGSGSHSAPNHAFVTDVSTISDSSLISPVIFVSNQPSQLSFRNAYNTELNFDGGVLEIAIEGGDFQDILLAGGSFVSGGYVSELSGDYQNPLSFRQAWHGNSGGYLTTLVNLPAASLGKSVQLRWRMGTDNSVAGVGWQIDTIQLSPAAELFDYGDAPATYATLKANNGAAHALLNNLWLGTSVDAEADGQPTPTATGDGADEDGIATPMALSAGSASSITIVASAPGLLNAWIDFAADGNWSQAVDQVVRDLPLVAGANNITISVPSGAALGTTMSRWRFSSQAGLSYDGTAPDGEVEDYAVTINADSTPPQISSIKVTGNIAGNAWSPDFKNFLDPVDSVTTDGSDQIGYELPDQTVTLPWINMNQIVVSFSESVVGSGVINTPSAVQLADVNVFGVNKSNYKTPGPGVHGNEPTLVGMSFNPGTNEATLTFDAALQRDILTFQVNAGVINDAIGNFLGAFSFQLNVLPGDAVGDGFVISQDVGDVRFNQFSRVLATSFPGGPVYTARRDVDGDGYVISNDVGAVRVRQFTRLPTPPPAPMFDGDGDGNDKGNGERDDKEKLNSAVDWKIAFDLVFDDLDF